MSVDESRMAFVTLWGSLGTEWGISRSMAQVHAYLLLEPEAAPAEQMMEELQMSRGNLNAVLHELMDWQLIQRKRKLGDRKDFFEAEKDMWKVAVHIVRERRKRELAPAMNELKTIQAGLNPADAPQSARARQMAATLNALLEVIGQADQFLSLVIRIRHTWLARFLQFAQRFITRQKDL